MLLAERYTELLIILTEISYTEKNYFTLSFITKPEKAKHPSRKQIIREEEQDWQEARREGKDGHGEGWTY